MRRGSEVFKELGKLDWAVIAICLAASLFFGIYSIKLAIDYRAMVNAPAGTQRPSGS
jgi:hypothetical protein